MKTVKVSEKGQIAIPHMFRKILNINKGDELILIQLDKKILIEKSQKTEEKIKENFRDILKFSEKSLKEVGDNKEYEIKSQIQKIF